MNAKPYTPTNVRKDIKDRYYRVFTYQQTDRVPDLEFGYWPQTIRRWLKEGLPAEYETEKNQMFSGKIDSYFGFDVCDHHGLNLRTHMNPVFEEKVIEKKGNSIILRDSSGSIAERYPNDVEESSIPHFIEFPVKTPDDWKEMKARFRFDDPDRAIPDSEIAEARKAQAAGKCMTIWFCGFYGQLRNWMGMENLS